MKIATVLGTRPEIIRLSLIIDRLDSLVEQVLVHTGQNFDHKLSDVFFSELGVRQPDIHLGIVSSRFGRQAGLILEKTEEIFRDEKPDRLLILGDTNSSLCAIVAKRMGIQVFHMEAGNRCYDDRVPEEVNRRIIDHCSDVYMPYTERSKDNLLREGVASNRIFVTGNPIGEVMARHEDRISGSGILQELGVQACKYFLVTMHRAENVDQRDRLEGLIRAFDHLAGEYGLPVIISTHPRTRDRMNRLSPSLGSDKLRFLEPFGFFDFVALERDAFCVLSDSGTVQEECSILGVPNVTIRDVTERPETIDCGSNFISGADMESVRLGVKFATTRACNWTAPPEYLTKNVSDIVARIVTSYHAGLPSPRG